MTKRNRNFKKYIGFRKILKKIVTTIENKAEFYLAEDYHNYFNLNKNLPYCTIVIDPKIKKF